MEEALIRVRGGAYTSFLESKGAAMNLQKEGCGKDHELKKRVTDHIGVGSSGFDNSPPLSFGGLDKREERR
jgi:hypothetical protein